MTLDSDANPIPSQDLLSVALGGPDVSLQNAAIMIALDLSRPWTFEKSLSRWVKVAEEMVRAGRPAGLRG